MDALDEYLGEVRIPTVGDHVYKTEGVFSFENPEFPNGLYISLNTFQSYSYDNAVRISSTKPDSHVFLHVKEVRTKKEVVEDGGEAQQQPTTLGIGVSGGFQCVDDVYDIETSYNIIVLPKQLSFKYPDPLLPATIRASVEGILKLEDAGKMREIKPWVEERNVSKFADNLIQLDNGIKISPNPRDWKCEDSRVTENLWLNLSTGYIGSGRKNWDGSGGTGAALRHYEDTGCKYPLVVKLGTITANGADVYSYDKDENDMVLDPKLADHLAHWGINMMKMEKTEKTMAELSIDLNLKYEFDAIQESGKELEKLVGPSYMGLRNLGNSCYMNSLLQVLFSVNEVKQRYVDAAVDIFTRAPKDAAKSLEVQFAKLGIALCTDLYCNENVPDDFIISPQMLRSLLGTGHPEFSSNRQQDVYEYYQHVLEQVKRDDHSNPTNINSIVKLFTFTMEERLECLQSNQVRYSTDDGHNALCLELPLDKVVNYEEVEAYYSKPDNKKRTKLCDASGPAGVIEFDSCVKHFMNPRIADGFLSPVTNARGQASVQSRMKTFPPYLMIQLKRYVRGEDWTPRKLNVRVKMPDTIDLNELRAHGLQDTETKLPDAQQQQQQQIQPDDGVVAQLLAFGMFTENGCKRAAIAGNNNVEAAMNWALEHMNDANFNTDPLSSNNGDNITDVDQEALIMLQSMGFAQGKAIKALKATGGDVERATNWLFSRVDDVDDDNKQQDDQNNNDGGGSSKYEMAAIISHMGPSTLVGHYVCHIKHDDNLWAIYNDRKVARSENPPIELGFMYLYKRV